MLFRRCGGYSFLLDTYAFCFSSVPDLHAPFVLKFISEVDIFIVSLFLIFLVWLVSLSSRIRCVGISLALPFHVAGGGWGVVFYVSQSVTTWF